MPLRRKHKWNCIRLLLLLAHWKNETPRTIKLLLGTSMQTNNKVAKELGLAPNFRKVFNNKMEQLLINNYKTHTNIELAEKIKKENLIFDTKITPTSVSVHLGKIGCRRTKKELATIKQKNSLRLLKDGRIQMPRTGEHPVGTYNLRNGKLYYKLKSGKWVLYKAYLYELHFGTIPTNKRVRVIDNDEENIVIENLMLCDVNEGICNAMKNKIDTVILGYLKNSKPEIYKNPEMIQWLKTNGQDIIELKRSQLQLKKAIKGKSGKAPPKSWPPEQEKLLKENYGFEPMYYICKRLEMSYDQVKYKADTLGLQGRNISMWGKMAMDIVINKMEYYNNREIAELLNKIPNYAKRKFTPESIKVLMERTGLKRSPEAIKRMLAKKRKY